MLTSPLLFGEGDDFDRMLASGELDRVRAASGYEDGEDPEAVDGRRHGVGVRVLVNLLAGAAQRGDIKPAEALEAIRDVSSQGRPSGQGRRRLSPHSQE